MNLVRKLGAILGLKGFLSLFSLTVIGLALMTYTANVTINPTLQFTVGATSASWTVYTNDVNKTRYLPGSGSPEGSQEPTLNASDTGTYAFRVVTDAYKVSAVRIELISTVNSSKFSKFEIVVKHWNGSAWDNETLYDAATGSNNKPYIDGLASGDFGYIHQGTLETTYYLLKVAYSYDLTDDTNQINVTFQYTPSPLDSF